MCYQDAGWKYGPWIGSGDSIRNNSVYVTWREYFERVTDGRSSDDYRMPQEDVRVSLMWGSQVLQRIAQQVRESENKLVMAEKAGVIGQPRERLPLRAGNARRGLADADARPAPRLVDRTLQRAQQAGDMGAAHPAAGRPPPTRCATG